MVKEAIDLDHYKHLLKERLRLLEEFAETGREAAGTVELDQTRQGRLSRMDALQQQAMASESNRRREVEVQHIEAALQRIAEDDFGYCSQCGEAIAPGRLEVDPTVTLCIGCAEKSER